MESVQQPALVASQIESSVPVTAGLALRPVIQPVEVSTTASTPTPAQPEASVAAAPSPGVAAPQTAAPVIVGQVVASAIPKAAGPTPPAVVIPTPIPTPTAGEPVMAPPVQVAVTPAPPVTQQVPTPGSQRVALPPAPQLVATAPSAPVAEQAERTPSPAQSITPPPVAAVEPEPTASSPLLVAQAAPRPQATIADLPRAAVPAVPQAGPAPAPSLPATPQAALAQMLPEALAKQNSAGPLLAMLAIAVERPNLLPEPILRAALGVLAQRIVVTDGKVLAAGLEAAVAKSGVLLEANLSRAEPEPWDAKAGLLALRGALAKFLGETPATAPHDAPPPPLKGLPLRATTADLPPLPDVQRDAVRTLHGQADAAVSRTKLLQLASLPDTDPARPSTPSLRMELPFLIGHELVMAQLQISRDSARREVERKRGWTMRFALNFSATGEVGAEVGLLGKAVNVALWAVEPETAAALNDALPDLAVALSAIGLNPGAMRIKQGTPEPERPASGRLLDSVT